MGNRLEVKVDGNSSGFKHTMDTVRTEAKGAMDSISHSWTGGLLTSLAGGIVGALSFEGVRASFERFIGRASEIKDMADELNMSAEATQKWTKAADDLNQSWGGVYNAITAIQSKREEALRDPKAADLFSALGVTREQVLSENASDFAKRVLLAGGQSDASRAILEQIVGRRGLRAIPVAGRYDAARPDFDAVALDAATKARDAEKTIGHWYDRFLGKTATNIVGMGNTLADPQKREGFFHFFTHILSNANILGVLRGAFRKDRLQKFVTDTVGSEPQQSVPDTFPRHYRRGFGSTPVSSSVEDPLEGVKAQQEKEFALRQEEGELALHEAQRRNLTIAERKKSIAGDLSLINAEISARDKAQKAGLIFGMTAKQQSNLLPTDVKKQLQDDAMALLGLQTRAAGFTNELLENTGFRFDADSLARVGLYSAATVNINPMVSIGQEQVRLLRSIDNKVGRPGAHDR